MRKRFKRFFRFQLSLPASSCRASAFLFVSRRRRRRPENEGRIIDCPLKLFALVGSVRSVKRRLRWKTTRRGGWFSPLDYNSFSSPRSRPLAVPSYSVRSRTGILHSPAPVEAALAGASRFEDRAGVTRFVIFRDPSSEILFFVLDRRRETIYNKNGKKRGGGPDQGDRR